MPLFFVVYPASEIPYTTVIGIAVPVSLVILVTLLILVLMLVICVIYYRKRKLILLVQ